MRRLRDMGWALVQLRSMTAADTCPTLYDAELMLLLEDVAVARIWTPDTAVLVGDRVVPTVYNGSMYQVAPEWNGAHGGTTGSTEPTWQAPPGWPRMAPYRVRDNDLYWTNCGTEPTCLWDLRAAAYEGWLLKAGKASGDYASSIEGQSMHPEQVHAHCLKMADRYRPVDFS